MACEEDPSFDHIDHCETQCIAAAEDEEKRDRGWSRDRWWLERAKAFVVDEIDGFNVRIILLEDIWGDRWVVERGGVMICEPGYSDRESALQAYEEWKKQQKEGDRDD